MDVSGGATQVFGRRCEVSVWVLWDVVRRGGGKVPGSPGHGLGRFGPGLGDFCELNKWPRASWNSDMMHLSCTTYFYEKNIRFCSCEKIKWRMMFGNHPCIFEYYRTF
jgi:hypothetical protein